jgi:trimethylamine:corrinoid methyltransferase-like protein
VDEAKMTLTKPNQDLRIELKEIAFGLEQAANDVLSITKDCRDVDPIAVLKLIAKLYEHADRVAALADEVVEV